MPLQSDFFNELDLLGPDLPFEYEWNPCYELSVINLDELHSLIKDACIKPLENDESELVLA